MWYTSDGMTLYITVAWSLYGMAIYTPEHNISVERQRRHCHKQQKQSWQGCFLWTLWSIRDSDLVSSVKVMNAWLAGNKSPKTKSPQHCTSLPSWSSLILLSCFPSLSSCCGEVTEAAEVSLNAVVSYMSLPHNPHPQAERSCDTVLVHRWCLSWR